MREEEFTVDKPGRLVANLQGALTFAPNPLPPANLVFTLPLIRQFGAVDNMLGRLDGTAKGLPDRRILIRSFVRREAQLSSYIENTYARYEDVANAENQAQSEMAEPVRETLNAERAISAGVDAVFEHGRPVTLQLIRQMHGILLNGVRGHGSRGKFREIQVFIGSTRDVDVARFVPPPPHLLDELMTSLALYLPDTGDLPPAARLALLHYQFETIHPFEDGNGRLGRILILLGLCQHKLLSVPVFNASLYFERNRQEYYDRLMRVSTHGEWINWISFFVEGLRVAAIESFEKLDELVNLRADYHRRLQSARNSALLLKLVDMLFMRPVVRISDAAAEMDVTYPPAQKSIQKLVDARILSEFKPRSIPARFIAKGILKAVNAEPTRR